jgi:hypothetical protein
MPLKNRGGTLPGLQQRRMPTPWIAIGGVCCDPCKGGWGSGETLQGSRSSIGSLTNMRIPLAGNPPLFNLTSQAIHTVHLLTRRFQNLVGLSYTHRLVEGLVTGSCAFNVNCISRLHSTSLENICNCCEYIHMKCYCYFVNSSL